MDEQTQSRWGSRLFLAGALLFCAGFIGYVASGPRLSGYRFNRHPVQPMITPEVHPDPRPGDRFTLVLDRTVTVGRTRLVYRGLKKDRILLEAVIADLDSQYAYRIRLSIAEAEAGFRIAGRKYKLASAGRADIRLEMIR